MGIVTPPILSIIVCVALRLILYKKEPEDHIIPRRVERSYRTGKNCEIVLYMGFGVRKKKRREMEQSDVSA